jgi:hypothetical protein
MDEDLVNYHLKEIRCGTQCHTKKVVVDNFKRFRDLFQQHQILYIVLQSTIVQA